MFKRTITPTRTPNRLSYLWLAMAAALYLFTGGQWAIPLAAWLAPLFRPHAAPAAWTTACLARKICCRCHFCPTRDSISPRHVSRHWLLRACFVL